MKIIAIIVIMGMVFAVASACYSRQQPAASHSRDSSIPVRTGSGSYVAVHNSFRHQLSKGSVRNQPKATNVFDLKYDKELEREAAKISATCKFAHVMVRDSRFAVGQNLYMSTNERRWEDAVQAWFDEHTVYRYPNNPSGKTGHYTQLVWASTKYVGCAYSKCRGFYFYVCNYGPAGNYIGQKPYETR